MLNPLQDCPIAQRRTCLRWMACAPLVAALPAVCQGAQSSGLLEAQVKGAFVFKFGEFVEWPGGAGPADPDAPFHIAVLGRHPMVQVLEELSRQRKVNGHPVMISLVDDEQPMPAAHILVVGDSQASRLAALSAQLQAARVLSVTDSDDADAPVGIINFVIRDNRVRFEIDADAAEATGLKISSKVLSLAVSVKRRG